MMGCVVANTFMVRACRLQLGSTVVSGAEKQQEMEEADWLMNAAAAGEVSWDDIRGGVADRYAAAGLSEVADFIRAA